MTVTATPSHRAVRAVADTLVTHTDELCALDSVAGDGDHGLAMASAAKGMLAMLDAGPPDDDVALLRAVGQEFSKVGGSMGALLLVAAEAAADTLAAAQPPYDATVVARMLAAAQAEISDLGGAAPGDKTMVDALDAARAAAESAGAVPAADCLRTVADAARAGAEATATMPARMGRASRLGDRSLGSADAGATSFALVMDAVASSYESEEE